ncbi:PAP2 superfamily protein [Spironucleus salmonicida]|uniref:PAP2 superfamily protein n=1 Tax=Spironucleus salmonicida TaxID=348837 RepID=V6M4P3_9EUKA|nr:PAP2 superfamily protein [Spironucleus salmonicida]|eukprot:EST48319.1 PAP2 superfamily protein [Spironucleus salmonicida]
MRAYKFCWKSPAIYIPTIVTIVIALLMLLFASALTEIDYQLALMIKAQSIEATGIFHFMNVYFYLMAVFPLILLTGLAIFIVFFKMPKQIKWAFVTQQAVSFMAYVGVSFIIMQSLKATINRPRPYQVQIFSNTTSHTCFVDFLPFGHYNSNKTSGCDFKMHSCPSGHTFTTTVFLSSNLLILRSSYRELLRFRQFEKAIKIIFPVLTVFAVLLLVLIPVVMIARIQASAHFFSDVSLGFVLTFALGGVWDVLEVQYDREAEGNAVNSITF